jgi:hypothetical protein
MSMFPLHYILICEPLCRVPRDINLDSSAKSSTVGGESPKVDKPRSPQAEKTALEPLRPPSPKDVQHSSHTGGALPSATHAASGHNPTCASTGLEPTESPEAYPPRHQSYGLRSADGHQTGEGSSVPQSKKPS